MYNVCHDYHFDNVNSLKCIINYNRIKSLLKNYTLFICDVEKNKSSTSQISVL